MSKATFFIAGWLTLGGCVTPSQADMDARAEEARQITRARAVHMPPEGRDSCVGVTLRLTQGNPAADQELSAAASKITDAEVSAAMADAGVTTCHEVYLNGIETQGITSEPLQIKFGYGIDPDGKVCAVVEHTRADPIDPSAIPLIDSSADCLKNVLFKAKFPAGRVEEQERVVRVYELNVSPTKTTTTS